jgi:hypothetical protein
MPPLKSPAPQAAAADKLRRGELRFATRVCIRTGCPAWCRGMNGDGRLEATIYLASLQLAQTDISTGIGLSSVRRRSAARSALLFRGS